MSTIQRQRQQDPLAYRSQEDDYKYEMDKLSLRNPPLYQPPPITPRPPHQSHPPPPAKEDIKVIHFGVV